MSFRQFFSRLTGAQAAVNPNEAEYRRLSQLGDEARNQQQYIRAEQYYVDGLTLAQSSNDAPAIEVFLGLMGALYAAQRNYDRAVHYLTDALSKASQSGEPYRRARATLNMGAYHLMREQYGEAQRYLEEAMSLSRQAADTTTLTLAVCNLADIHLKQNNAAYALRLLRDVVPQALTNQSLASGLIGRLGRAHLAIGETDRGKAALLQAIGFAEQNGQRDLEAQWSAALAEQAYKEGLLDEALRYYNRVEQIGGEGFATNLPVGFMRYALIRQSAAHAAMGRSEEAITAAQRALDLAKEADDPETEASALLALGNAYNRAHRTTEAITALQSAISLFTDFSNQPKMREELVNALLALGTLHQEQGNAAEALQQFDKALELAGDTDRMGRAQTLRSIGAILHKQGNLSAAIEKWTEALNLYELSNAPAHAARLLCDIGGARRSLSGINAALADFERATILINSTKDAATRGYVLSNVANVYTDLGEVETAQAFYQESIHLARQLANRRAESLRIGNFGWFYIMTGRPEEGQRLIEEALSITQSLNDPLVVAVQTSNLGLAKHELKQYALAEGHFREAMAAVLNAKSDDEPRWLATFRSNLGRSLAAQGKLDEALTELNAALTVHRQVNDQEGAARTLVRLGDVYLKLGRLEEAEANAKEGENIARKWGYRKGHADGLMVRAGVAQKRGDSATYDELIREAKRLYSILHDPMAKDLARLLGE
ncbi:MAG: tetratricopeptide repeat protein [Anaerolineae bacterium]